MRVTSDRLAPFPGAHDPGPSPPVTYVAPFAGPDVNAGAEPSNPSDCSAAMFAARILFTRSYFGRAAPATIPNAAFSPSTRLGAMFDSPSLLPRPVAGSSMYSNHSTPTT